MPNPFLVAFVTAFGLLTSTLALADAPEGIIRENQSNTLEVPAIVAAGITAPAAVEPESEISVSADSADASKAATGDTDADTLDELVQQVNVSELSNDEANCLATTIYYEARSESLKGQLAVAHVVLERSRSGRFPTSVCGVVTQPRQFSFVRGGRLPTPTHAGQWRTARAIAQIAMDGSWENPVEGALYFHATSVSPAWKHDRVSRIGGHIFYR